MCPGGRFPADPDLDGRCDAERGGRGWWLVLPVAPTSAPRARVTKRARADGKAIGYYPARYVQWINLVRLLTTAALQSVQIPLITSASIRLSAVFVTQHATRRGPNTKRPDLSNYVKAVEDALNGIAWKDDALIVEYGRCGKYWGNKNEIALIWRIVEDESMPP
jgi:Holliday junction resolvase RusA-like endonuclease